MKLPKSSAALNTSWCYSSTLSSTRPKASWFGTIQQSSCGQHHYGYRTDQEHACPLVSAPTHLVIFRGWFQQSFVVLFRFVLFFGSLLSSAFPISSVISILGGFSMEYRLGGRQSLATTFSLYIVFLLPDCHEMLFRVLYQAVLALSHSPWVMPCYPSNGWAQNTVEQAQACPLPIVPSSHLLQQLGSWLYSNALKVPAFPLESFIFYPFSKQSQYNLKL